MRACVCVALQEGKGILMHCTKFGTKDLIAQTTSLSSHLHPPFPPCKLYFKTEKQHIKTTALPNTYTKSHARMDARPQKNTRSSQECSHTQNTCCTTVYVYVCICVHTHIHTCVYMYINLYSFIYIYIQYVCVVCFCFASCS